ncbi:unnamed protein product, partial [Arabidopsis halleri]
YFSHDFLKISFYLFRFSLSPVLVFSSGIIIEKLVYIHVSNKIYFKNRFYFTNFREKIVPVCNKNCLRM